MDFVRVSLKYLFQIQVSVKKYGGEWYARKFNLSIGSYI